MKITVKAEMQNKYGVNCIEPIRCALSFVGLLLDEDVLLVVVMAMVNIFCTF